MNPIKILSLCGALAAIPTLAQADSNPSMPYYGYGAIVATPHYPIAGEMAHVDVSVANTGTTAAENVEVKLSYNDWGVTFMGWQEIGTVTVPVIGPGSTVTVGFDHIFETRTHTCLEALIIGANENVIVVDDRGQINLEVINAGETFSYNVPIVNNGDGALNLLVAGGCKGPDGTANGPDCKPVQEKVRLEPGEEALAPVKVGLERAQIGQAVEFVVEAFDLGSGAPLEPNNRNHVKLRIIKNSARNLVKTALNTLQSLQGALGNKKNQQTAAQGIAQLEKALKQPRWAGDNALANGGPEVFAHAKNAVRSGLDLLGSDLPLTVKMQIDEAVRQLVDGCRILAQTAQAASNSADADALIATGDKRRKAGSYDEAIALYGAAWKAATH